jgi:hypothetical protein
VAHSPASKTSPDISKAWTARSLLSATKTAQDEAIQVALRRFAPEAIFSVAVAEIPES